MRNSIAFFVLCAFACTSLLAEDQAAPAETPSAATADPAHDELRSLRDQVVGAYEKRDLEELLKHVHGDAVITWQNGERNRGPEGLRKFYQKMMEGDDRIVESVTSEVAVDDLSVIHGGDAAVAFGTVNDQYKLTDGTDFALTSRWTATLVKEENEWTIASFHMSANVFDNPILDAAKSYLLTVGVIAGLVGLLVGAVLMKLLGKSQTPAA